MSKVIAIAATATYANPVNITVTNTFDPTKDEVSALAELGLPLKDNDVWNTGLASVGDPHIDEIARGASDVAIVEDGNTWTAKHVASFRLFKTNSFVYLLPGDSITIAAVTAEEVLYYALLHGEFITVTTSAVTPGADHPEEEVKVAAQLNRTTGVGDFDDGEADNGVYPFQFNTEDATEGKLGADRFTVTVEGGTADKATAKEGDTVTVTLEAGKTFDAATSDPEVEITEGEGVVTFTMPASDITVTVTYTD